MPNYRFPKARRLLRPGDFERVFAARLSAADAAIVLYGVANDLGHPRLGLTVSRKAGTAVARNRWKRLIREAFRLTQHELPPLDLVCIPKPAAHPALAQLMKSLPELAGRLQQKLHKRQLSHQDSPPWHDEHDGK
jgi:ribonuclease P protein component